MKEHKGRILLAVIAVLMLVLLGWTVWRNAQSFNIVDTTEAYTVMLEGEYSIDGGEPQRIDNQKPIGEHFKRAVFRGRLIENIDAFGLMSVSSKNVWYRLYDKTGKELCSYQPLVSSTPGYHVNQVNLDDKPVTREDYTLEVEYPYENAADSFSDCFKIVLSESEGVYLRFFFDALPSILMFLSVCFFGVFFFPGAAGLLGRIDQRYPAFGALCFFAGAYMVVGRFSGYMNLWILDPAVCMMTDKLACYFFATAVLIYFRSLLKNKITKIIASSVIAAFFVMTALCVILQEANIADMVSTEPSTSYAMVFCAIAMTAALIMEIKGKTGLGLIHYLFAWVPLVMSLIVDILDLFLSIPGGAHLRFGLAFTIIYQLVRFAVDFRRRYKEAVRYQQVQRELYEAKVSVMVSQIRPHFMYNALSSIAILCRLDPDTAYTATVTFSDYLRGNMDSLRQTAPVPFTTELEHLKKYLYIEKLRFADMLNIEYDIQDTDFELPLLSIQPLVENAVKHGVGMKEDGGTVKISTRQTETSHEIIIEDDGAGFDVSETKDDGRSHVGMENTKKRLYEMCGGEVIITSEVGVGTTAKVIIPKNKLASLKIPATR